MNHAFETFKKHIANLTAPLFYLRGTIGLQHEFVDLDPRRDDDSKTTLRTVVLWDDDSETDFAITATILTPTDTEIETIEMALHRLAFKHRFMVAGNNYDQRQYYFTTNRRRDFDQLIADNYYGYGRAFRFETDEEVMERYNELSAAHRRRAILLGCLRPLRELTLEMCDIDDDPEVWLHIDTVSSCDFHTADTESLTRAVQASKWLARHIRAWNSNSEQSAKRRRAEKAAQQVLDDDE
jgi:hypothetical protein